MAQTTVSVRMDEELKQQFEKTCDDLGLNMSTAVIMLAKKMTREQRIPFDVSVDPFYSPANMNALRESAEQMRAGRVVNKTLEALLEAEDIKEHPERYPSYATAHEMVESFLSEMDSKDEGDD